MPVVEQAEVRLVAQQEAVAAVERGGDRVEVGLAEDVAGRIDRRVHDRERRLRPDGRRVLVPVVGDRALPAGGVDELREEERRRVRHGAPPERAGGEVEALHAAERHDHVPLRVDAVLGGDRLAQRR